MKQKTDEETILELMDRLEYVINQNSFFGQQPLNITVFGFDSICIHNNLDGFDMRQIISEFAHVHFISESLVISN